MERGVQKTFDFSGGPGEEQVDLAEAADEFDSATDLDELRRAAAACTRCRLRAGCGGVVFGEGAPDALVMFVGEGPGEAEDEQGRPFVGRAGQLLDKIIQAARMKREDVYITNVVKCRPPGNRMPGVDEVQACSPILRGEMRIIMPRIVVCLGALATQSIIDPRAKITKVRGQWVEKGGASYIPTFHPAAVLRDESKKIPVWEDFRKIRDRYMEIVRASR